MRQQAIVGNTNFCASKFEPFAIWPRLISDLRLLISPLCALAFTLTVVPLSLLFSCSVLDATSAAAAQPARISHIGFQSDSPFASIAKRVEGFRQGLRELGYVEGKDIIIEWRSSDGKFERRPEIASELVRLKLDVIVSGGPTVTRALREVTTTIPIVMAQDTDPVGNGFVASLARPGGNITGLSNQASEMSGKKLGLLKEMIPKLSRVAIIGNSTVPGDAL